ncbi:hypothetical protein LYSHEL_03990 [Lysobacter helvus]|uniref:DUF2785 domain-containing protein n=2 Tax=Lysobacteraceae TaxID=32033 RepID=A0ABN6FPZ7_9GAMM|nr:MULTISPECIES: DUF2785 domain-containing protein [Lysobacter]BCT91375.1 hypothetical protein LYSCAS_03990 [Lysobacter caseinilyticus]BCT94528.1 hypothetical protein LYSHEL_03990 [Lysobacter helvus]
MLRSFAAVSLIALALVAIPAQAACPPEGQTKESLLALKALQFTLPDAAARQALAEGLVDCLGDPDPAIRDGVAYEALAHWMRAKEIDAAGLRSLRDKLYVALQGDDPEGFRRPFAALVLSEVARTDRIAPWMTPEERNAMIDAAVRFMPSVTDYRGFDEKEGWRHGVAHGSDWLLQLALNPALDRKQADRILEGVSSQVVPPATHAYVFGEPGRLGRPVLAIAHRGLLTPAEWETWLSAFAPRLGAEEKRYLDAGWLAKRHDLLAFLTGLYLEADQSTDPQLQALEPPIVAALKTVP